MKADSIPSHQPSQESVRSTKRTSRQNRRRDRRHNSPKKEHDLGKVEWPLCHSELTCHMEPGPNSIQGETTHHQCSTVRENAELLHEPLTRRRGCLVHRLPSNELDPTMDVNQWDVYDAISTAEQQLEMDEFECLLQQESMRYEYFSTFIDGMDLVGEYDDTRKSCCIPHGDDDGDTAMTELTCDSIELTKRKSPHLISHVFMDEKDDSDHVDDSYIELKG